MSSGRNSTARFTIGSNTVPMDEISPTDVYPPISAVITTTTDFNQADDSLCPAGGSPETIDDDEGDALQLSLAEAAQGLHCNRWPIEADAMAVKRPRSAQLDGYSLHADVAVSDLDRRGLRRLLR